MWVSGRTVLSGERFRRGSQQLALRPMAHASDPALLVLLGLRVKGFTSVDGLDEVIGIGPDKISTHLKDFRNKELVLFREGRMTGWSLSAAGRAQGEQWLAAELKAAGVRPTVQQSYRMFLSLNPEMLGLCNEWQMSDSGTLNDHSNQAYDAAVISKLGELHAKAAPICEELGGVLDRYLPYTGRLESALQRLQSGENDWFTSVRTASYHTVWFELHENLIATLGVDRAKEA